MMLQAVCWQDYPHDCCSVAYTTIIIIRYLIHFSGDLKYLGAASTPTMHLPHSSTDPMRLYHHFTQHLTNRSRFSRLYYILFTSFQMIMDLRVLQHLPSPPLPSPAPSVLNIAFVHTEKKAAEWKSHSASLAPKMPNMRVKAAVGHKQHAGVCTDAVLDTFGAFLPSLRLPVASQRLKMSVMTGLSASSERENISSSFQIIKLTLK